MFLNWEGKPKIKNSKQFSKKNLKDNLDNYANNNKLNLLIKSNNNVAISSIVDSNAINKINANGGIKLIYIDPPYFTEKDQIMKGNNKIAYQDIFDHSIEEYMNHIYIHIKLLYEILHQSGSIYIHIDYRTSSYIKIILDEIFGRKNLKGYIIWNVNNGAKSKNFWSNQHNDILVYSKSDKFIFNSDSKLLKTEFSESSLKTHFRKKDSNGRAYRERIINSKKYRYFADEGKLVGSVWNDIKSMEANSPLMKEYTKYPTQKPLSLLSRIISASTNEGDIVLDSYCGSGTTLESAEKLNRNWIGIDQADESISIIKRRLKKNNFYSI